MGHEFLLFAFGCYLAYNVGKAVGRAEEQLIMAEEAEVFMQEMHHVLEEAQQKHEDKLKEESDSEKE